MTAPNTNQTEQLSSDVTEEDPSVTTNDEMGVVLIRLALNERYNRAQRKNVESVVFKEAPYINIPSLVAVVTLCFIPRFFRLHYYDDRALFILSGTVFVGTSLYRFYKIIRFTRGVDDQGSAATVDWGKPISLDIINDILFPDIILIALFVFVYNFDTLTRSHSN